MFMTHKTILRQILKHLYYKSRDVSMYFKKMNCNESYTCMDIYMYILTHGCTHCHGTLTDTFIEAD